MRIKPYLCTLILLHGITFTSFLRSAWGMSATEVGKVAKAVTVMITTDESNGSGVLITKDGDTYTVLTAAHVVKDRPKSLEIITPNGQKYAITGTTITPDADLATVKFTSKTSLQVAKLGDANKSSEGATVYVSGFPSVTQVITKTIYNFTEGKVTANAARPLSYGYSLVYSNNTLPGMSGGPVFNADGELIAIHGRGDFQESSKPSEINENVRIKTGFNLGITISTVLKLSNGLGLKFSEVALGSSPVVAAPKSDDFFLQGVDRFRRGKWAEAIAMMDRAIQLNPKYLRAYTARGAANYMLNQIGKGLADMESVIAIAPNYATGYAGKCFLLNELHQWQQALGFCDRAIKLDPKLSIAYNVRGLVNANLQDSDSAQTDLEQAIDLDPNSYYAYYNLGLLYALRRNLPKAFSFVEKALQINPQSAGSRVLLGQLLIATQNYQQALTILNEAIAINPNISYAYEARAAAYLGLGNTNLAQRDRQTAQSTAISSPQGFIEDLSFLNQ
ncbi:TPR repeat-containing protein [Synechococcus sp. PCC 7502]|uniref:tetratricopeptide repeat-containing S1 family peptidase n=1 Tax=Synechococcus sp. PCC 7502 TaxID=1173263 RepID=UPI00029F9A92|nr:tetratricopeptide repeat-containing serine protease family protein [Synechococcus sp. PCC 7502]AFY73290.1 TPR repeat-containing protein [Synechococcus sp. PCC 7502]